MRDSDDWDFIMREQDDYEMAKFLEDLDAESEKVSEDCIRNMIHRNLMIGVITAQQIPMTESEAEAHMNEAVAETVFYMR